MAKTKLLPEYKILEWYPPFLFMGVKIKSVSSDYRKLHAQLPLRWYGKNLHGTMFGGFMAAASDPIASLLCGKIFPGLEVWAQNHCIDFLRPGQGTLDLKVEVTDSDVAQIREALKTQGKVSHVFEFYFTDHSGGKIARVRNTVYLRVNR
ncbi:MAG: DUF4442 domain-containing protein [Bdellovibrionota bacterium]